MIFAIYLSTQTKIIWNIMWAGEDYEEEFDSVDKTESKDRAKAEDNTKKIICKTKAKAKNEP